MSKLSPSFLIATATAATATAATATVAYCSSTRPSPSAPHCPPIESNFMEKIRQKSYLHYASSSSPSTSVQGVPSKLRIITVDLPEFNRTISEKCTVDPSVIFPDGVVKTFVKKSEKGAKGAKAWAKSLKNCGNFIEILETSIENMEGEEAYKEEISIRLNGSLPKFTSSMSQGSRLNKWIFGTVYSYRKPVQDGENVPQAVVADGNVLEKKEGSLLLLSSACKSAGIPLIVINDPRTKWNNRDRNNAEEEETFEEELFNAARKCRERVKGDVVKRALRIKEGGAFERGKEQGRKGAEIQSKMQRRRDEQRWQRKLEERERIIRELRARLAGQGNNTSANNINNNNAGNPQAE
ncbi:hypothetical protein TrST_g8082 [Triparma strigata]|uniref:Uncharacterized protein n=1 Tax=Triparma strigata TaxID=1606541 RepID=A0A9W6ZM35_9STRA|nr:hypothetical protein TrST_g8082 [Triparma strigata]